MKDVGTPYPSGVSSKYTHTCMYMGNQSEHSKGETHRFWASICVRMPRLNHR